MDHNSNNSTRPSHPSAPGATQPLPDPSGAAAPKRRSRWLGSAIAIALVAALAGGAWYLVQSKKTPMGMAGGPPGSRVDDARLSERTVIGGSGFEVLATL